MPPRSPYPAPDLRAKIAFLSAPRAYPHRPSQVRPIETHMSWLFLTGSTVYKFKKPVKFPFLDFSTLGRRRHYCEAELRLNRRLADDIYRRLVPLCVDAEGELNLDGRGKVVEWLIEMEQLPHADMLDVRLRNGRVSPGEITAVAERLGHFYARARSQRSAGYAYLRHLEIESGVNRKLLTHRRCGLPSSRTTAVLDRVEALLDRFKPAIVERVRSGCVIEGHGDLRPEHVVLGPTPRLIDCLEFDRSMRLLDPYDETNYLGLECEMLGAAWIRPLLLKTVDQLVGRPPDAGLLGFYGAFRAVLRARICVAHLLDQVPMDPERWPREAERYLDVAERECAIAEG